MQEDTDIAQEEIQEVASPIEGAQENADVAVGEENIGKEVQQEQEEVKIPLSALQKERRKRQEAEYKAKLYEEMQARQMNHSQQASQEEPEDLYEAATKAELREFEAKTIRAIDERSWIRQNPEKVEEINEKLTEFLKQRPHLTSAIEKAPNRYEEAWTLMNALSPKQKLALKTPAAPKRDAPGSPAAMPKAAAMNQAVDVMNMTDSEFSAWRASQKKAR